MQPNCKMYVWRKPAVFWCFTYACNFSLAIAYVLIGNGLYDEAIRQFSTMLQVSFLFGLLKPNVVFKGKKTNNKNQTCHFMKLSDLTYGFY